MRLLVLAGGFGTRLKTAVGEVPKALAPVGHVPFLQLQIEHWLDQGLRNFTFLLHHQAEQIIQFLKLQQMGPLRKCEVDWIIEPRPMDTGGAIAHAVKEFGLTKNLLITNADTWLGSGIRELISSAPMSMAVVNLRDVSRYGQVCIDQRNQVKAFIEKTGQKNAGWINAGLYHLPAELFTNWNGQPFSLERELFTTLVQSGGLRAVRLQTEFIDIGIPADYRSFCLWFGTGRQTILCN